MSKAKSEIHNEDHKIEHLNEQQIISVGLRKSWSLTCEAYGIDPDNPPKMEKKMFFAGSFEDHQKYMDEQERNLRNK
ncbi:MAG: hypothetical protein ACKOU7_04145 [Ferruginibacter sp.]